MRRKTHEEFVTELAMKNKNIIVVGEYQNDRAKIEMKCRICGHVWLASPGNILQGKGCPECGKKSSAKSRTKSHNAFLQEMAILDENIEVLGKYSKSHTKIKCRCKEHNVIFYASPTHLLRKETGCAKCIDRKNHLSGLKSNEEFVSQVFKINEDVELLEEYDGASKHIRVRCKKCGNVWNPIAYSLLAGFGCPVCNVSKGEKKIKKILDNMDITYRQQIRFSDLRGVGHLPLSYDFYIQSCNLLIEFQGEQHAKPISAFRGESYFPTQLEHDRRKKEYALTHGYNFLEIWFDDNIEEVLSSKLNDLMNPVTTTA